jgi:hypothetical protein
MFTAAERAQLALADRQIDAGAHETHRQRQARFSRESRERRRERMGDDAYRAMCRARMAAWKARHA